ncbi:MAG: T9SS type A sorting domain-containing protein [Bacteroidetes bacterium]|nr:T9SS type A sorting domain-containing protein [Bacteroidota bacterium]
MNLSALLMKRQMITSILLLTVSLIFGQVTFILNTIPEDTPPEDIIYIAGDLNGWDPGNPDYELTKNENDLWDITLPEEPDGTTILFKFTRGDWGTVEKGESGEEIANREFIYGNGDTVTVDILNWADNGGGGTTATDNVYILDEDFYMPQLDRNRRIWIYLPPDYDNNSEKYPVLYMHDGQNLFDTFTSYAGEWEIDETLNELYDEGYRVPIVVGIDNGGGERINEYTPWVNTEYGGGQGSEYMEFLVNTLKPYIDDNYRTHTNRENTGIMGSSLGGLISLYGALKYQDVYGSSGIFSPAYWISDSVWAFTSEAGKQQNMKIYQLIGSLEGEENVQGMWNMNDTLTELGFGSEELFSKEVQSGEHNEIMWRANFRDAYLWMFAEFANDIGETQGYKQIVISPNPVDDVLRLSVQESDDYDSLRILDTSGRVLIALYNSSEKVIPVESLIPGSYIVVISFDNINYCGKFLKK